jgi:molybdopterin molybdotransferase
MPSPSVALLSVAEADRILAGFSAAPESLWPPESVALDAAVGRILREDIHADRAYPAQDRSRMDGIGITHVDWEQGIRTFVVAGLARAGDLRAVLSREAARSTCVEIMTGAAVPEGADTVIPYEEVVIEDGVARVRDGASVRHRQFVHVAGSDCAHGDVLVASGARLQAAQIAVAASVGKTMLRVARRPRVAIVATGDELVGVHESPLEHQLRVSNAHGLAALFAPWAEASLHRCGDDPAALEALLKTVLSASDLVLVSGGVSAGKFDVVPATLEALGVRKVFHKLAQKPGKPLWFGRFDATSSGPNGEAGAEEARPETLVFGLPGNPVSSLMCARRFVLPLLWAKSGLSAPSAFSVPLGTDVDAPSRLTQYLPVRVVRRAVIHSETVAESHAVPCAVNGSGDFAALGGSDGFLELPPAQNHYPAGAIMAYFPWSP